MAKEENKSGGLLAKVARFVRHPTVNWSDLENLNQESEESQYSKQALKEMLERKRQNDFVRKREFEQLRKLRQAQLSKTAVTARAPLETPTPLAASSFLQTAQNSMPGERAETIKKIDEIEAQMAQQWWRGKQMADATTMPLQLPEGGNVMPSTFRTQPPASISSLPVLNDTVASDLTLPKPGMLGAGAVSAIPLLGETDFSPGFATTEVSAPADINMVPPSFANFEHDVALEDAAIVFASGDNAAAEANLKGLIAKRAQDTPAQLKTWMALLDMYRAAGMQAEFEDAAMDFVARFGRSAPQWFAMPQQAGRLSENTTDAPVQAGFRWQAPVQLGESSLKALIASKARSPAPWVMDWSALENIEPAAQKPLQEAVEQWATEKGELIFAGHQRLLAVLSKHCPSGDRSVDQNCWYLRLAMQRLMHLQDDFELTALDYCVTYELSPPSWIDPVSTYSNEGQDGNKPVAPDSRLLGPETIQPGMLWKERKPRFSLQGVIEGDALPWLAEVQTKAKLGEAIAIDCALLVRMDFAAAGSVLNWAAHMQELGHVLRFSELHQLLAVFFNVVGIQEHAQVIPRKD